MLLEWLEFEGDVRLLHVFLGLAIGLAFGIAAQITRFCIRRAIVGRDQDARQAGALWLTAFAVGIASFAAAQIFGLVALDDHRLWNPELPVVAITIGGAMFGVGMVLTRGCISRLTVLSATGNLRAALVLLVFAVVAHSTLKGLLAPMRTALGSLTFDLPFGSLAELPGFAPVLGIFGLGLALHFAWKARLPAPHIALGALVGLLPVIGWMGTSLLLLDEFDPLPIQSVAFTLPHSDSLFWVIAASAIPASFGVGLIGGVLVGSFASAALRGDLAWQSFETPAQTGRYMLGAVLMGMGGVLAGGCTVGAGLSGSASLSVASLIALGAIIMGGMAANRLLNTAEIAIPAE